MLVQQQHHQQQQHQHHSSNPHQMVATSSSIASSSSSSSSSGSTAGPMQFDQLPHDLENVQPITMMGNQDDMMMLPMLNDINVLLGRQDIVDDLRNNNNNEDEKMFIDESGGDTKNAKLTQNGIIIIRFYL